MLNEKKKIKRMDAEFLNEKIGEWLRIRKNLIKENLYGGPGVTQGSYADAYWTGQNDLRLELEEFLKGVK